MSKHAKRKERKKEGKKENCYTLNVRADFEAHYFLRIFLFFKGNFLISIATWGLSHMILLHLAPEHVDGQDSPALQFTPSLFPVFTQCHIIKAYPRPETQALCVSHMTPLWFLRNSGYYVTWSNVERKQDYS